MCNHVRREGFPQENRAKTLWQRYYITDCNFRRARINPTLWIKRKGRRSTTCAWMRKIHTHTKKKSKKWEEGMERRRLEKERKSKIDWRREEININKMSLREISAHLRRQLHHLAPCDGKTSARFVNISTREVKRVHQKDCLEWQKMVD